MQVTLIQAQLGAFLLSTDISNNIYVHKISCTADGTGTAAVNEASSLLLLLIFFSPGDYVLRLFFSTAAESTTEIAEEGLQNVYR